jgi:alpha-D-ribose 1-methylphosphonate 5-triphosphate diphosphatase PhnM
MAEPLILAHARLVLADEIIEDGWIVAENGPISGFGRGRPPASAEDVAGDLVIPGLVELHTDLGLNDRGEIAVGKRADLARVRASDKVPVVRAVWCAGRRVA